MEVDFYTIRNNKFVQAVRKVFPPEWRSLIFYYPVPKKNTVEFAHYLVVDGVELRQDWELTDEFLVSIADEENQYVAILQFMKDLVDAEIADDIVERVREQNKFVVGQ